jgi:hypothetical protein
MRLWAASVEMTDFCRMSGFVERRILWFGMALADEDLFQFLQAGALSHDDEEVAG